MKINNENVIIPLNDSDRLRYIGYNINDVKLVYEKTNQEIIKFLISKPYDNNYIKIITNSSYIKENFYDYINLYESNNLNNIDYLITIKNNCSLISSCINILKEKYFLEKNLNRYIDYVNKNLSLTANEVVTNINANIDYPFYSNIKKSNLDFKNIILVNKYYNLDMGYVPDNLTNINPKYNHSSSGKLTYEAATAFNNMANKASQENITIKNLSAYRSYSLQNQLYINYTNKYGLASANTFSAKPGHSEHQTGLAVDVNLVAGAFENTKEYQWLQKNAHLYGFILRYPKGKEHLTGYKFEPWHYRYVGVDIATYIYNNNITFDEYYAYFIEK